MLLLAGFVIGLVWSNWVAVCLPSLGHALAQSVPACRDAPHPASFRSFRSATHHNDIWLLGGHLYDERSALGCSRPAAPFANAAGAGYSISALYRCGDRDHLRTHDGRWVPESWRAHHLSHHRRPQKNFNIFLALFDRLLGSREKCFLNTRRLVRPHSTPLRQKPI